MKDRYRGRVAGRAIVAVLSAVTLLSMGLFAQSAGAQTTWTCDGVPATIVGTPGDDVLRGTSGPDVIVGREGNDTITALDGDDLVCGGKGNDRIFGGEGFDILYGAQGNDTIYASDGSTPAERTDTRGARMFGGAGNDTIHGSNRWDRMQGGVGQDQLFGYEGRDWMRAGPDNDTVDGGPAIDDLHGGNGRDTIALTDGDSVRGGAGLDLCTISAGAPAFIRSCGLNSREVLKPPPDPNPTTGFSYTDFSGTSWTGEIYGLVSVGSDEFWNVGGRCLLLIGELTPQSLGHGVVSSGFDTPQVGVIAGGEYVSDSYECDESPALALGYDWILNAEALPGTTIPFFAHIHIPATNTGAITSIVAGDPRFSNDYVTFAPTMLPSVPTPTGLQVGAPAPAKPLDGSATFTYTENADSAWFGEIFQVLPAAFDRFSSQSGRCFIVLGELTPTMIDGLVSSGFDTPSIGGIAGGRYITSGYGCDTSSVEAQGYGWILDAEVTVGTTYRFYSMIVVPDANKGPLNQIVVGPEWGEAVVYNV